MGNILKNRFQFHKVRLKGGVTKKMKMNVQMFQFHKVRLKAMFDIP